MKCRFNNRFNKVTHPWLYSVNTLSDSELDGARVGLGEAGAALAREIALASAHAPDLWVEEWVAGCDGPTPSGFRTDPTTLGVSLATCPFGMGASPSAKAHYESGKLALCCAQNDGDPSRAARLNRIRAAVDASGHFGCAINLHMIASAGRAPIGGRA